MLVTGGAGYIGSHAAKALRADGYRVTIYDNLSAGHRWAALGAPLIEGDIRDVDTVRRALRDTGASAVMHFAAWLNVSDSVTDPVGYYRNNVMGTLATLEAMAVAKKQFGSRVTYADANYTALKGADALAIVTEWNEFRRPDFERMRSLMKTPVIFDGRNLFVPAQMKQSGFTYYSIGRR